VINKNSSGFALVVVFISTLLFWNGYLFFFWFLLLKITLFNPAQSWFWSGVINLGHCAQSAENCHFPQTDGKTDRTAVIKMAVGLCHRSIRNKKTRILDWLGYYDAKKTDNIHSSVRNVKITINHVVRCTCTICSLLDSILWQTGRHATVLHVNRQKRPAWWYFTSFMVVWFSISNYR